MRNSSVNAECAGVHASVSVRTFLDNACAFSRFHLLLLDDILHRIHGIIFIIINIVAVAIATIAALVVIAPTVIVTRGMAE